MTNGSLHAESTDTRITSTIKPNVAAQNITLLLACCNEGTTQSARAAVRMLRQMKEGKGKAIGHDVDLNNAAFNGHASASSHEGVKYAEESLCEMINNNLMSTDDK